MEIFVPKPLTVSASAPKWARECRTLEESLQASGGSWFHRFAFDNGAQTYGRDPSARKLKALQLPESLRGFTLIDVGAYEGYFTFHSAQRGASVTANDHFVWNLPKDPSRRHFDSVAEVVGIRCETIDLAIENLPSLGRRWDIVLFLGVLYHLEDPIGGLRAIRAITGRVAVLETVIDRLDHPEASAAFYSALNNDTSNQFGPNLEALWAMASKAGFSNFEVCNIWDVNTVALVSGAPTLAPVTSGRAVVYLYP